MSETVITMPYQSWPDTMRPGRPTPAGAIGYHWLRPGSHPDDASRDLIGLWKPRAVTRAGDGGIDGNWTLLPREGRAVPMPIGEVAMGYFYRGEVR